MATNKEIVETALSFVGKLKYVFGGDNIAGGSGDCSDFTQYVYSCYGINIGGTTESQYSQGVSVARDDIQAGDLILFKNTYNSHYRDGVSHVGIAIGNNQFVHLSSGGCKVSDLSGYYDEHYLDARRVTGVNYITFNPEDLDVDNVTYTQTQTGIGNKFGLAWWGDVVRVIVIVVLIIATVVLIATSVGVEILEKGVNTNG